VTQRIGGTTVDYGYLWWPMPKGDPTHTGAFEARGIFGQHLYINQSNRETRDGCAERQAKTDGLDRHHDAAFFAAVSRVLK
jgi:CubicO group peptidase (beta-lactamase class C family)